MKLPFPRFLARVPVQVILEEHGEEGVTEKVIYSGLCIFDEKARTIRTPDKQLVRLEALVIIEGDILPCTEIRGRVEVGAGPARVIGRVSRPRNPDGSVFSTELELL